MKNQLSQFAKQHEMVMLAFWIGLLVVIVAPIYLFMRAHNGFNQPNYCPDTVVKYTANPTQEDCYEGSSVYGTSGQ